MPSGNSPGFAGFRNTGGYTLEVVMKYINIVFSSCNNGF
jgi:hypothetical protein